MKTIKILGGGISGLTAAINLRKRGYNVEVHEKKEYCGKHTRDFQFLENWTLGGDVLSYLRSINIETNFHYKAEKEVDFYSPDFSLFQGRSRETVMYLVRRGRAKDSIDCSLKDQAEKLGVELFFQSDLDAGKADIIATGIKVPNFIASGYTFRLKHKSKSVVLLDNQFSSGAYSYFACHNNEGEIVVINPVGTKVIKKRLDQAVEKFEEILSVKIKGEKRFFSASASFSLPETARKGGQYYIGEAAGFQDYFAGFGMVYAFQSGYLAAKAISENLNFDQLWKKEFLKKLKISERNRKEYEKLTNEDFDKVINGLNNNPLVRLLPGNDLRRIMRLLYCHDWSPYLFRLLTALP